MSSPTAPQSEREIFFEALTKKTPAERAAFLDSACSENPGMRDRLEQLFAGYSDDTFLENLMVGVRPDRVPVAESPGAVIGRYKLLEKIGEGGMGVVYMAEQREPVVRKVALKIIKLGMDSKQVVARFEAERQALALMDHTNIARVLDGGVADSGR